MSDEILFRKQTLTALRLISYAISDIREGLPWPASEHVGFRLEEVEEAIDDLKQTFDDSLEGGER